MENIREMLVDIQLALSSSHNTITTDDVNAQPDSTHWRIDHAKPVKQINEIAERLGINLYGSPRCASDNNQKEYGIIPAGTEITFGHCCTTTLEHDLEVSIPQEIINRKIAERNAHVRGERHLLVRADIKKELESRDLSQQERKILNQAVVYELDPKIIENFKRELESPDLQQKSRDALSNAFECLTDIQALANLWLNELRVWLQSHPMKDSI